MPPTITYGTPLAESSPFITFAANFASDMQCQQPTMATTGPGVPQPMNTPVSASTGADYTTSQSGSTGPLDAIINNKMQCTIPYNKLLY